MNHKGTELGRPSEYKPEYCQKLIEYFDRDPSESAKYDDKGHIIHGPIPPMFGRFAHKVAKVSYETLDRWRSEYPEFRLAYQQAKEMQKEFIQEAMTAGLSTGGAAVFAAKNMTDMRDEQHIDHTSKGERLEVTLTPAMIAATKAYEESMKEALLTEE